MKKGYIHVYTGDGKGKTTASLGLAVRAAGAGLKVFIAQFVKGRDYSELKTLDYLRDWITIRRYGRKSFIHGNPRPEDIQAAQKGISQVREVLLSGDYDLVILDEINIAVFLKIITVEEVMNLISLKPDNVELVLTGRRAPEEVIRRADLVTEMKSIKHYYDKGVQARTGIEK